MTDPNDSAQPCLKKSTQWPRKSGIGTFPEDSLPVAIHSHSPGLTKREHFAALAMQGLLAKHGPYMKGQNPDGLASSESGMLAVKHADSLIAALNAEQPKETT